jgi:hypothetical protein
MTRKLVLAGLAVAAVAATALAAGQGPAYGTQEALRIGGAEAAGFFKEATGFDSESEVSERRR